MHPNFWKYFAITSVSACITILVAWALWPSNSSESQTIDPRMRVVQYSKEEENTEEKKEAHISRITFFAAGDIMLDRTMFLLAQKHNDFGYPFRMISSTLKDADIRVVNLEGPITTNKSISNGVGGARFSFTFSPKVTTTLKENFDIVSLANNHTTNFGFEGLEQTKKFLDEAGIGWFGDPNNRAGQKLSTIVEKNGIKIGFVGHHQLVEKGFENVIAEIKNIRSEVDVLIAYPHWGIEYITSTPSALQKKEAHEMIDAGVDIIIGAHPHVIQPIELYKGKPIFYSLGNFVFDQYFSYETMRGLLLGGYVEKNATIVSGRIVLHPIYINTESQPYFAEKDDSKKILESLARVSSVDDVIKNSIREGVLEFSYSVTTSIDK